MVGNAKLKLGLLIICLIRLYCDSYILMTNQEKILDSYFCFDNFLSKKKKKGIYKHKTE